MAEPMPAPALPGAATAAMSLDLRPRVLTALVIAPVALLAILYAAPHALEALLAGVLLLVAWEWSALSGLARARERIAAVAAATLALLLAWRAQPAVQVTLMVGGAVFWVLALGWLRRPDVGASRTRASVAAKLALGALVTCAVFAAGLQLLARPGGRGLLLYVIALACALDTSAYFLGRHVVGFAPSRPIAPRINPGKNYGVLACALLATAAVAVALAALAMPDIDAARVLFFQGMLAAAFGVVGDLLSSLMKRHADRKDSGMLLPGHGGVVDRLDSLLAALPVFATAQLLAGALPRGAA